MQITEPYTGKSGVPYKLDYFDVDSFSELNYSQCRQVYGVCFCDDKMIIGYGGTKESWGLIGGTIETGETFEQTLKREIQEESNTEVLAALPIGYQKVTDTRDNSFIYQLRYACLVKPHGPFVSDPDGSITEIKLIDPIDFKKYFDWGKIGDRIIERALELKPHLVRQLWSAPFRDFALYIWQIKAVLVWLETLKLHICCRKNF